MKLHRWACVWLILGALIVASSAFAQDGPLPRRIDPGQPPVPELGGGGDWSFVNITGQLPGSSLGTLAARANGTVYVWSMHREYVPVVAGGDLPRRVDPGEPPFPREGGWPGAAPPSEGGTQPIINRIDNGDAPPEGTSGSDPLVPMHYVTTSTLYQFTGGLWSPSLVVSNETGVSVFMAKSGDLFAATDLPDGTIRVYRYHAGEWRMEGLPDGVRGPAGDFAGENVIFLRSGDAILRHTGNHWKVELTCDDMATGGGLAYLGRNQILASCNVDEHIFDGNAWIENDESIPMHVHTAWGARDAQGVLHLFQGGANGEHTAMQIYEMVESDPGTLTGQSHLDIQEPAVCAGNCPGFVRHLWGLGPHDVYATGEAHGMGHLLWFDGSRWFDIAPMANLPATVGVGGTRWDGMWVSLTDGRLLHRPGDGSSPAMETTDPSGAPIGPLGSDLEPRVAEDLVVLGGPSSRATLEFSLPSAREVTLSVFDLGGRRMATVAPGQLPAGVNRLTWEAEDAPSGIYFCRLDAGALNAMRKVVIHR